jgi:hypothetical protein
MQSVKFNSWIRNSLAGLPILLIWMVGSEREARAYADPGTGTMIVQMLAAAIAGGFFYIRRFTNWLKLGKRKVTEE